MEAFKVLAKAAPENLSPGQAPGSGTGAQSSAGSGGDAANTGAGGAAGGASQTAAGGDATSTGSSPAEQSVNAAGRVSQSFLGLAVTVMATLWVL